MWCVRVCLCVRACVVFVCDMGVYVCVVCSECVCGFGGCEWCVWYVCVGCVFGCVLFVFVVWCVCEVFVVCVCSCV